VVAELQWRRVVARRHKNQFRLKITISFYYFLLLDSFEPFNDVFNHFVDLFNCLNFLLNRFIVARLIDGLNVDEAEIGLAADQLLEGRFSFVNVVRMVIAGRSFDLR
jgi:hypothetical protein